MWAKDDFSAGAGKSTAVCESSMTRTAKPLEILVIYLGSNYAITTTAVIKRIRLVFQLNILGGIVADWG